MGIKYFGAHVAGDVALDSRLDTVETTLPNKADLVSGAIPDGQIPAGVARDDEVSTAVAAEASARESALAGKAPRDLVTTTQTASYTLTLADASKVVEFNAAAAVTLTVPTAATVAFPDGTVIKIRQYGAGQVTVAGATGVTIRSRGGALRTSAQYAEATLTKRTGDEWVLTGDIVV